jgi:hypothetical protein
MLRDSPLELAACESLDIISKELQIINILKKYNERGDKAIHPLYLVLDLAVLTVTKGLKHFPPNDLALKLFYIYCRRLGPSALGPLLLPGRSYL